MFRLLKRLRLIDYLLLALICGLTVLQVYCTMKMTDFMANLIRSITMVSYHNNPESAGEGIFSMYQAAGSWENLYEMAKSSSLSQELISMVYEIKNASDIDIWRNAGLMVAVVAGSVGCQIAIAVFASAITASFATNIRKDLNERINSFSLAEISKFSPASLITRTTNDIENVQMTFLMMMRMVFSAPVTMIWAICKIQSTSGELTLVTSFFVIALLVGLLTIFILVVPKFKLTQNLIDKINLISRENINGIRVIHAYNGESFQEEKFKKTNDFYTKIEKFTSRAIGLFDPLITLIMDGICLAVYWVGSSLINQGTTDYSVVSSFMMLSTQVIMAFMMLLMMFIMLPRAIVSAKRIVEVLDEKPSIIDPKEEAELIESGTIEFQNVSFAYPGADKPVISGIDFKANKGDTIAIIGPTGSGKTTLVNLIARFYDAAEGIIKIDGAPIKEIKQETLRKKIGFVPQKGNLFTGTVSSNIKFGAPDISDEEVKEASYIACASEFIEKMEKGYDSPIAQGGSNVSGGQRQRLCIARAIAIKPEIYVFDDSFSALDLKTDLTLRTNLKNTQKEATKVIVAQRVGTIMDADLIIVLDQGKIVGKGKHEQLLRECKMYRDIALSQLSKEELGL